MDYMCCLPLHLREAGARFGSLYGRNLMRCYTLIRFHAIWGFRVSIMPSWQRHSTVVFFFHFTCEWCVEIHWFRWRVKPSPNRHLSSFFLSFLSKDGLMFPICGKGNSIFPLSLFLTLVALPPSESGSILLFRSHSAAEKKPGRCDKSGLTLKSPPPSKKKKKTHKGFPLDRFLTQWLSLNPKLGRFSFFLSLSLATAGFQSTGRASERALKSTLSLIQ